MSYDLRLVNGDISIGKDGAMETVFDDSKLRQDIIKILLTKIGENKFNKNYGSHLGKLEIGGIIDSDIIEAEIQSSAEEAVRKLILLQQSQVKSQYLTPGESIVGIKDITIERDQQRPYIYNVMISVYTKKFTVISEAVPVRIM